MARRRARFSACTMAEPFEHRPDISVTLQAVRELLPKLMEQGFHFEKVTDILCPTKN